MTKRQASKRKPQQQRHRPRPWIAMAITGLLCGLAAQDQLASGKIDAPLLGLLLILVLFWAGHSIDRILDRWLG